MENEKIIIQTERLRLTKMLQTDRQEVLQLYFHTNSVAARFNENGGVISETAQDVAWAEINRDTLNYVIRDKTDTLIGRVCMQHLSDDCPEVGIELFEQYRNQGFGSEALTAFISWFKSAYGTPYVKARIMQDNTHSKHIFEKLGAVYINNETALKKTTIDRIKEVLPESDVSELEIRNVLVYQL